MADRIGAAKMVAHSVVQTVGMKVFSMVALWVDKLVV